MMQTPRLTVREVRARPVMVPVDPPLETAGGTISTAPLVLVDALTAEGVTGSSYLFCYTPAALHPTARLVLNFGELIEGEPAAPAIVAEKLQRHVRLLGPQGLTGMAIAAIDIALWDALAKACGLPLAGLLGGAPGPIPAYASLGAITPERVAAEAEDAVRRGFTAVKIKVGRSDLAADLDAIRAVRRAAGDRVSLMVDYNQCLTFPEAIRRAGALDGEGLTWIEEPVRADDDAGHAAVAREAQTPIQIGENWWGPHDMAKSLTAGASDVVMIDVTKIGGVSGWLRGAALAEAAGMPASSHIFPEISAHLLAATPTRHWLEYLDFAGPLLRTPLELRDGRLATGTGPGIGLDWDEEAVERLLAR
ncbi:MAG TPA: enolase C-terminal domain-like protein [bacterium]|nr:enolase C-terminal domain-like protein [bacterium]